jgi:hypothetical protein
MGNCGSSSLASPAVSQQRKSAKKAALYEQPIFKKMAMTSSFHGALMAVGASTQELFFSRRKKKKNARQAKHDVMHQKQSPSSSDVRDKPEGNVKSPEHHAPIYRSLSTLFFKVELLTPDGNHDEKYFDSSRPQSDASTRVESLGSCSSDMSIEDETTTQTQSQITKPRITTNMLKGTTASLHRRNHSSASSGSVDWRDADGGDPVWREKLSDLRMRYDWDDLPMDELVDAQVGEAKNISILRRIGNNTLQRRKYTPTSRVATPSRARGCGGLPPTGLDFVSPQVV